MSDRITQKDLEAVAERINRTAGTPLHAYTREADRNKAAVGHYYIDGAYGGVQLVQMVNESGGIRTITSGYSTKRELYYQMQAFLKGMEVAK